MSYNGYSNRATWNAALWLNNDYGLYQTTRNMGASELEDFCNEIWKFTNDYGQSVFVTPDGDCLSEVDWDEVSEAVSDEDEDEEDEEDED